MTKDSVPQWDIACNWRFAAASCGIRGDVGRLDLALIASTTPATAAGVFTQNRVYAAPVRVCRERLPTAEARGLVVCSGNANACTGQQGYQDAVRMCALAAEMVSCRPEQVLVGSTGVIGRPLPMPKIENGIRQAGAALEPSATAFHSTARALLTTDTCIKR